MTTSLDQIHRAQAARERLLNSENTLREMAASDDAYDASEGSRTRRAQLETIFENSIADAKRRLADLPEATFPCLVCDKPLDNEFHDHPNQPRRGVAARSYGNYGSTVFDSDMIDRPADEAPYLEFNICDDCLRAKAGAIWHVARRVGHRIVKSGPFRPDQDDELELPPHIREVVEDSMAHNHDAGRPTRQRLREIAEQVAETDRELLDRLADQEVTKRLTREEMLALPANELREYLARGGGWTVGAQAVTRKGRSAQRPAELPVDMPDNNVGH